MGHVLLRAVGAAVAAAYVSASEVPAAGLTIVTEFRGPHSERSVAEMKRELGSILKDSGIVVDWRTREEAEHAAFPEMVVVRFKGKCVMEPIGFLYDERGPLAFTYSSDGALLPFSEVACDRIASSIRLAMWGGDFARADLLLGRAMGRVVAHELVHILSHSADHAREGVAGKSLSPSQLISRRLALTREDLDRIHRPVKSGQ